MIDTRRLRPLALLDGLSDDQVGQLAAAGESFAFGRGDELFQQSARPGSGGCCWTAGSPCPDGSGTTRSWSAR